MPSHVPVFSFALRYISSMKAASVQEIKQELKTLRPAELVELCLRMARFKKENKELLTYLLFEAQDENGYMRSVCAEIDAGFDGINLSHLYFARKTLRKIVRHINKYARYSNVKETDLALRLHFCERLLASGIPFRQSQVLLNLYNNQVKKASALLEDLHEDLQYEYRSRLEKIMAIKK